MFENNDRISPRQLSRQLGLAFLGVWLFLLSGFVAEQGKEGILGVVIGGFLLMVYIFFLVRLSGAYRCFLRRTGRFGKAVFSAVILVWAVSVGSLLLRMTAEMAAVYLLPGIKTEYLAVLIILTAVLGSGAGIQTRARMAEISFPVIACAFLVMLVIAAFQMKQPPAVESAAFSGKDMFRTVYVIGSAGSCICLFPFLLPQVEGASGAGKILYKYIGLLVLFLAGAALVMLGVFGYEGISHRRIPVLSLMAEGNIPGGFLERFDIIWISILLYSLFFSLGSLLFYSGHLSGLCGWKPLAARGITAALIGLCAVGTLKGITILEIFPLLFQWVYVPLFLLLTLWIALVYRRRP